MSHRSRSLNIAMICDPISDSKAGVLVSAIRFGKLLSERGHNVIFIGAKNGQNQESIAGIKTYAFRSLPLPKSGGWHLAFPTPSEMKEIFVKEKIDIVHIILPMSGALSALRAARKLGIKVVAHSHSQPENIFMNVPRLFRRSLSLLWNRYLGWIYSKADTIIYPTRMAEELLNGLCDSQKPSTVISNGIHIELFKPAENNFTPNTKRKFRLIFVGRLHPEKSIETLILAISVALKKYPNLEAVVVGGGYLRSKLENLAHSLGVEKHIKFLGVVSDERLISELNAADIFISPSLAELEGMSVLEAMACGKPILIADSPSSAARFFVDGNGYLFRARDANHLAENILKLISDPASLEAMSQKSLELSRKYDIRQSADRLEAVYYNLTLRIDQNGIPTQSL